MAQVLPLAAGAAISPALLALQMLNLSRPRSPMAWAWSVVVGAGAVLLAATAAAFMFAFGTGGTDTDPELKGVVKLVGAGALVAVAVYELRWAKQAPPAPAHKADEDGENRRLRGPAIGLGALLVAPNLALYFPAAHELATADESDAARLLLLVVVLGIAMLPVAAPPLAVAVLGERARPTLDAINSYVTDHRRGVTAAACVVFAVGLAVSGAVQLSR